MLFVVWSCNNDDDTTAPDASTNSAPTLDATTLNAAENVLGGQKIGDITAQDEDGDPLEFTLSGDTPFLLSKTGELTLAEDEQLDYEDITEYELNVSVSDGTASDNGTITLKVMDVDEAPKFELEFFQFGTEESKDNTEPIGTVVATDPEGTTLEYSITENDQDLFTIDKATGTIRVAEGKTLNFEAFEGEEAVYNITVEATDQENQTSIAVRITLADGDEFPVFAEPSYTFKVEETKLEIGEVSATDPENDPLTYSIAVNDGELFVINAETGKITLAEGKTMDFEAFGEGETPEYNITVQATDPGENMTQVSVTIEITDVEEAPKVTTEGFEIAENSTEVGKVLATDPQEDVITFALAPDGDADGLFTILDDGTIQVTEDNTLNYEAEVQAYEITVVVEDNFGNSTEATIDITVTNVDEAPELISSTTITVDEDVPHPEVFALLMATDPEGEEVTFEFINNENNIFLMTAEGAIYLADGQQLDYEVLPNLYELNVQVSDGTNEVMYEIEIQVQDVLDQLPDDSSTSFITTWETTGANETIRIGLNNQYNYNFYVDWGDGNVDHIILNNPNSFLHEYKDANTYSVAIQRSFPAIRMGSQDLNPDDRDKLQTIEQWGTIEWQNMELAFLACENLTYNANLAPNLENVSSMHQMFRDAENFNGDLSNWNTSFVTSMSFMFQGAINFDGNLSGWNTINVSNMSEMFSGATSFTGQGLSSWDTDNVRFMYAMFYEATAFNVDLSGWVTHNVETMQSMFRGADAFGGNGLENWDTGNVTDMSFMFSEASAFDANLGNWNIQNIEEMDGMFNNSGLSTNNYSATLEGWATLDDDEAQIPTFVDFTNQDGMMYCLDAELERDDLITNYNWEISGDAPTGADCN